MLKKTFLALLWASMFATAAAPDFLLGFDYSQWMFDRARTMATDASGAIYIVRGESTPGVNGLQSSVTKLSPDGKSIVWQNQLPFDVSNMVVDPSGEVYVTPIRPDGVVAVAKLNADGLGLEWISPAVIPPPQLYFPLLTVDASGRSYVSLGPKLARVSADGSTIDYSITAVGTIYSIAADAAGSAFVTTDSSLTRFAPDGSVGFQAPLKQAGGQIVQLDANGNAVVNTSLTLDRFDAKGVMISSATIGPPPLTGSVGYSSAFALDKAGNAYVTGLSSRGYYPVKNTLAQCGVQFLTVIAPDGTVLQTTYLPGAGFGSPSPVSIGKDGSVLVTALAAPNLAPSRSGPLPMGQAPGAILLSLSRTATADTFPLACISNAGSYTTGAVTAGELVSLFGNGLGPQQGAQPNATLETPYPTRFADVQVTFDGKPAPILYAQDGQVNVVAPWSLDKTRNTQVCLSYQNVTRKCLSWPTAEGSPGVFLSYDLNNFAIALNQDGSANSEANPAAPDSLVSVFVNGLGTVTPQPVDGSLINLPLPSNLVAATVQALVPNFNGPFGLGTSVVPSEVTYYGPAPFRVAGVSQVNFRLNTNIAATYRIGLADGFSLDFRIFVKTQ